jgi:hypothetical protein
MDETPIYTERNSIFPQLFLGSIIIFFVWNTSRLDDPIVRGILILLVILSVVIVSTRKVEVYKTHIVSSVKLLGISKRIDFNDTLTVRVRGYVRAFSGIQFIFRKGNIFMNVTLSQTHAKTLVDVCRVADVKMEFSRGTSHIQ